MPSLVPPAAIVWIARQLGCSPDACAFTPLLAEASTRRFFRVSNARESRGVFMISPPATEMNAQFVALAKKFRQHGIGVPAVHAYEPDQGWLLVEDLGENLLEACYATPREASALDAAFATLVKLQRIDASGIPAYTTNRVTDELNIFDEWFVGKYLDTAPFPGMRGVAKSIVDVWCQQPSVPVHRDYHCRNLLLRDDGVLGVVDFQDALVGPATYDLVSLLRDCYHDFREATVRSRIDRYRLLATANGLLEDVDANTYARWCDFTGAQRHLKAIGIFARLALRDGRTTHLGSIPRTLGYLTAVGARQSALRELSIWLAEHVAPRLAATTR